MRGAERTMMDRLTKIGNVRAMSAKEVDTSRLGIGFEKLDRAVFDPEKAYGPLAKIGVKYVRIQSGWQRYSETGIIYGVGTAFPCTAPVGLVPYFIIAYSAAEMDDKRTHICYPCVEGFIREERRASDSSVCLCGSLVVYLVPVNYVHPRYHAVGA